MRDLKLACLGELREMTSFEPSRSNFWKYLHFWALVKISVASCFCFCCDSSSCLLLLSQNGAEPHWLWKKRPGMAVWTEVRSFRRCQRISCWCFYLKTKQMHAYDYRNQQPWLRHENLTLGGKITTTMYDSFYGPHRYCSDCLHVKLKTDPKTLTTSWHQVPI